MDDEVAAAFFRLNVRLEEAELRGKILSYALRGAVAYVNPTAQTAARRMANTAVLAYCPEGERGRRLKLLEEVFPGPGTAALQMESFSPDHRSLS